jgi:hypothetical protein
LERWGSGSIAVSQKMLDVAILRFIIEDIQSLSIVDSPAFINLVRIGMPSSVRILCRKTLRIKLSQTYLKMKTALKNKLAQIEIVSTTADLWSKAKRLFNFLIIFLFCTLISLAFNILLIYREI